MSIAIFDMFFYISLIYILYMLLINYFYELNDYLLIYKTKKYIIYFYLHIKKFYTIFYFNQIFYTLLIFIKNSTERK